MMPSKFIAGLCAVAFAAVASGEIRLAENGRTDYTIVAPEKPSRSVRMICLYCSVVSATVFLFMINPP